MNKIILGLIGIIFTLNAGEVYATFNVVAKDSADLAFDANGVVKVVKTDIADEVKKGDVLAYLGNSDKKATLEIAKTTLKYAKKDYERQLKVKKLINADVFDTYAYKYENAKNQLAYQQAMYDKTFLKAPFDGIILYKDLDVGDTLSGLMLKTVYKIQSLHARKLILEFDQKYNKIVKVGDVYKYKIDGDSKTHTGIINKIYPFANVNNRKIQAEIEAKNIVVGLFGSGSIITKD